MKNIPPVKSYDVEADEMLPEYNFDYRKARPNRFAIQQKAQTLHVVLDPDVAEVFTTSESVNAVLRALIATMPKVSTQ